MNLCFCLFNILFNAATFMYILGIIFVLFNINNKNLNVRLLWLMIKIVCCLNMYIKIFLLTRVLYVYGLTNNKQILMNV